MAYFSMKEREQKIRRNKPHGNYSTKGARKSRAISRTGKIESTILDSGADVDKGGLCPYHAYHKDD